MVFDTALLLSGPDWLLDLLDLSMRVTVLFTAAALTAFIMRRSPAHARHQVWTLAVVGSLLLPIASAVLPAWRPRVLPTLKRATSAPAAEEVFTALPAVTTPLALAAVHDDSSSASSADRAQWYPAPPKANVVKASSLWASLRNALPVSLGTWLFAVWLAGIAVVLARVAYDWAKLWRLAALAKPVHGERAQLFDEQQARFGLKNVALVELDSLDLPMAWGLFRGTVALPTASRRWGTTRLQAAMLHELAHVHRRDALTQLGAWLGSALYWFHPLAWVASKQMCVLREYACDDEVISRGVRPSTYAEQLIGIVQALNHDTADSSATLAMARRSPLGARLTALLDPGLPHARLRSTPAALLKLGALGLVLSAAVVRPAVAQDEKAPLHRLERTDAQQRRASASFEPTEPVPATPPVPSTPAAPPAPRPSLAPMATPAPAPTPLPVVAPAKVAPLSPITEPLSTRDLRTDSEELEELEAMRTASGGDERALTHSLKRLARDAAFKTETSRQAYLAAVATVHDDAHRFDALKALLVGAPISVETGRGVLAQAQRFTNDTHRLDLLEQLHRIRESDLVRGPLAMQYLDVAQQLTSQEALSQSLRTLLHPSEVQSAAVERAMSMARAITDTQLLNKVLVEVSDHQNFTPAVSQAYVELAQGLDEKTRAEALTSVLHPNEVSTQTVNLVMSNLATISEPALRQMVLVEVTDHQRITPEVEAAYPAATAGFSAQMLADVSERLANAKARKTNRWVWSWSGRRADPSELSPEQKTELQQVRERAKSLKQQAKEAAHAYKERLKSMQRELERKFGSNIDSDALGPEDVDLE